MEVINFITVCTDDYPTIYAKKIIKKLSSVSNLKFNHYCITDRPEELEDYCTPLHQEVKTKGWWNKMNLFSQNIPLGWCLYMDIDNVIIKNFDDEIKHIISMNKPISCVSDAINWMNVKFSSSLMIFRSREFTEFFEKFKDQHITLQNKEGGDQVWLGPQLKEINYIDDKYPYLKQNLKFHIGSMIGDKLIIPQEIQNKEIKIIDCGGKPKPQDLVSISYIKKNWHDIDVD